MRNCETFFQITLSGPINMADKAGLSMLWSVEKFSRAAVSVAFCFRLIRLSIDKIPLFPQNPIFRDILLHARAVSFLSVYTQYGYHTLDTDLLPYVQVRVTG